MPVIGLTGSIATGKSLVSGILKEMGARIVDADVIAREVVEPGLPAWKQIKEYFGEEVLNPDRSINRKILADKVFGDNEKISKLNEITHPVIIKKIDDEINEFRNSENIDKEILVADVPLLIETGSQNMVDEVWLVYIPRELQLQRLMERDGITRNQALKRVESQISVEEKRKYADVVIDNSGSIDETKQKVKQLVRRLLMKSGVDKIDN